MGRFTDLVAQNPQASERLKLIAGQLDADEATQAPAQQGIQLAPLPEFQQRAPQATEGTWKDVGVTALKGAVGAGEALVGMANIPTLGYAGKALESVGYDPKRTHQILNEEYSPYRQRLNQELQAADGFLPTIEYALRNPSTIGHAVVTSGPSVVLGGVLGRLSKAKGLVQSGAAAAGLGEGAVIAGSMAENIRQQTETGTLTPFQAGISALGGVAGGALGLAGGRIAAKLGIPDVDVAVSGVQQKLKGGYLSRVGKSAAVEGVAEELPQSAMEQTLTNIGLGRPAMEGVAESSAMGMLAGSAMGGGFAALKFAGTDPNTVTTEGVAKAVDEALTPAAQPAQPAQPAQLAPTPVPALPAPSIVTDAGSEAELLARQRANQMQQEAQTAQQEALGGGRPMSFTETATPVLERYLGLVERKAAEGSATSRDLNLMRALRAELGTREAPVEQPEFGTRDLFARKPEQEDISARLQAAAAEAPLPNQGPLVQPATPSQGIQVSAAEEKRQQRVEAMREKARQIAGRKTQFIAKLNAESDEDLVAEVLTRLEAGKSTNADFALAQHYGIVDAEGQTIDQQKRLQQAQVNLNKAERDASTNVLGANERLQAAAAEVEAVQNQVALIERAQAKRRGESDAVQEPSPAEVDVLEPAQDGTEVAEGDTQGNVVAEESQAESEVAAPTKADRILRDVAEAIKIVTNPQSSVEEASRSLAQVLQAADNNVRVARLAEKWFMKEHGSTARGKQLLVLANRHMLRNKKQLGENTVRAGDLGIDPDSPTAITDGKGGITPEALQGIVDDILPKLGKNVPRVVVLANPSQIQGVKLHPKTAGILGRSNTVVLFYENISDAEHAEMVLFHEIKGHFGLRGFFGKRLDPLLHQLHRADPTVRRIAEQHRKADPERYSREGVDAIAKSTEEVLADLAGENVTGPAWIKFLAGVQTLLRKMGFDKVADWIEKHTRAQALSMLVKAREFVVDGPQTEVAAEDTPASIAQTFKTFSQQAEQTGSKYLNSVLAKLKPKTRKQVLSWASLGHIQTRYKKYLNTDLYAKAQAIRESTNARFAQLFSDNIEMAYAKLLQESPQTAEEIGYLMSETQFDIDPRKPWDKHTHLHGEPNADNLKRLVTEANEVYRKLRQKKQNKVYDDAIAINEAMYYAQMAVALRNLIITDVQTKGIDAFKADPTEVFREDVKTHGSAEAARDYWKNVLESQTKAVQQHLDEQRGQAKNEADKDKQKSIYNRIHPLELRLRTINSAISQMERAPYFHLGRHGDYYVAFHIRKEQGKDTVDQTAKDHIAEELDRLGYSGFQISRDSTKPNVYLRLETEDQANNLFNEILRLRQEGWVDQDEKKPPSKGNRLEDGFKQHVPTEWITKLTESILASDVYDTEADIVKGQRPNAEKVATHLRAMYLDMLPDIALTKVMTHRDSVPGFSSDMMRNFATRLRVGAYAIANLAAAAPTTEAFTKMKADVNEARYQPGTDVFVRQDILSELTTRESNRGQMHTTSWVDTVRAINHAFFLGLSPAYFLINMTQPGTLLWPELSKKYGYVKSAKAIAKVTPIAFKIMQETFKAGKKLGLKRAADAVLTGPVLEAAGLDKATAAFIMRMVATGTIDLGNAAREIGRVADKGAESNTDVALRYASFMGYYSETMSRLIAALSARELYGDKPGLRDYAVHTVNQSMFNYATWAIGRKTGKMGVAGAYTPVMFSFMQYQFQLIEKLYRESLDAFSDDPETKAAARRFLGAHMAAVMVLAGSLGMPMATALAAAADSLCGLFSDDACDVKTAWRNFLSDTFGKDVGEVLARGAPRALGFDISQRAGEGDIVPFSRFLADKRAFEDRVKDLALHTLGSPVSMVYSMLKGGGQMFDGDVLQGMETAMPVAIKGPIKAFKMGTQGYTDAQGNVLPMEPGALDMLNQAIGLNPAEKAEYAEANLAQKSRKNVAKREGTLIRKNLSKAYEQQDADAFGDWYRKAMKYDAAHPESPILPGIGNVLQQRAKARAMSEAYNTPIGVRAQDAEAMTYTRYGNF